MGHYATGICFMDEVHHTATESAFEDIAKECSLKVRYRYILTETKLRPKWGCLTRLDRGATRPDRRASHYL